MIAIVRDGNACRCVPIVFVGHIRLQQFQLHQTSVSKHLQKSPADPLLSVPRGCGSLPTMVKGQRWKVLGGAVVPCGAVFCDRMESHFGGPPMH